MRRYRWKKRDGSWSGDAGLTKLMARAAIAIVVGSGPFTLTQDGEVIAKEIGRQGVLKKLKRRISTQPIGPVFRVRNGKDVVRFTARAVEVVPETDSTSGNDKADYFYNWVKAEFSEYGPRYAGAYVCKNVSGSTTLSQHSYGNAVDFFFDTLAHQDIVADAVVANAGTLHPYHVISQRRIWTKGQGWHSYGGDFHGHLHADFDPPQSGSCGVKG